MKQTTQIFLEGEGPTLNIFPKNKQKKLRQIKKDKINKESI